MSVYLKQVETFQDSRRHNLGEDEKVNSCIKVTTNGEISFDAVNKEYIVFEETYAYEVGRTSYPKVAVSMLETYVKNYLGE